MGDLSPHFSTHELECHGERCCGHSSPVQARLIATLEGYSRQAFMISRRHVPIRLTCGFRCLTHNRELGAGDGSQHPLGNAADTLWPVGLTKRQAVRCAVRAGFTWIIVYDWGMHLDLRKRRYHKLGGLNG